MDPSLKGEFATQDLAGAFAAADLEQWRALAEASLKGTDLEQLVRSTADGLRYGPLHTAAEPTPSTMPRLSVRDPLRPWDVRTLIEHPRPTHANAQALDDLENGATSILVRLRRPGSAGVACGDAHDLAAVLEGVHTDVAPVALDAGEIALDAAQWLSEAARRAPSAPLAFHMDPLGAFSREGGGRAIEPQLREAGRIAAGLSLTHRVATFFLANGRAVHEAGGTEAQELGFLAASALAYARAGAAAGMDEARAWSGVVFGLAADPRVFVGLAKLRAARLIGSRIAQAIGMDAPIRIEAYTAERTLSAVDPWNNLLRTAAAACGAVLGGADALIVAPFSAPLATRTTIPDAFARRQARNLQLVLLEENHLGRVADPAGGSWFVDHLTQGLARAGWAALQAIEAEGGACAALRSGRFAREVNGAREVLARSYARRESVLVGVSDFVSRQVPPAPLEEVAEADPAPARDAEPLNPPMPAWRASAPFEQLRRALDPQAPPLKVGVVRLDVSPTSAARLAWLRNLLALGDLEVASDSDSASRAVVLCGDDLAYQTDAIEVVARLRAQGAGAIWIVARSIPPTLSGRVDGAFAADHDAVAMLESLRAVA